jgi:hypothetical protein
MESLDIKTQKHFIEVVEKTKVLTIPFPHLVVDNILPNNIFDRLKDDLPDFNDLVPMSKTGWTSVKNYEKRGTLPFSELKSLNDVNVWETVQKVLESKSIENLLKAKFSLWLNESIKNYLRQPLRREVRVHCDLDNSHMTPHTDAPSMFITSFIYVKTGGIDKSIDTRLFVPKNPKQRLIMLESKKYGHEPTAWHSQTGNVQFRPNRMFSFLRTLDSIHGFGPVSSVAAPRYLISLHLKYAKELHL